MGRRPSSDNIALSKALAFLKFLIRRVHRQPLNQLARSDPETRTLRLATADVMGVPRGTVINFVRGTPDFSSLSRLVTDVPGLTGVHAVDQPLIVRHLAREFGMTQSNIRHWLAIENLRLHHFEGVRVQVPDATVHSLHHTGSAAALRGGR